MGYLDTNINSTQYDMTQQYCALSSNEGCFTIYESFEVNLLRT